MNREELKAVSNEDVVRTVTRCCVVREVKEEKHNGLIGGEQDETKD